MCWFRRALFLTFITITAISESTCSEKSSNSDLLSGGGSLEATSELLSPIRTRRKSLLSEAELKGQLELAKVNGLKRRFKRFACWHSCLGSFHRRIVQPTDMMSEYKLLVFYRHHADGTRSSESNEPMVDNNEESGSGKGKRRFESKSTKVTDEDALGGIPPDIPEDTLAALDSKRQSSDFEDKSYLFSESMDNENHQKIKKRTDGDFNGLTKQRKLVSRSRPEKVAEKISAASK